MAQRALKTDEEISAIPLDQEILIELPGGTDEGDGGAAEKPGKTPIDTGAKTLQEQLEAMQASQKASDDRAVRAEREAAEARRITADRERELNETRTRAASLEGDVINGGLSAAQAELAAAESELERAGESGDYKAMAKAQSRIGRASAQIVSFEAGAAEIAERPKPEARQEQARQAPVDPIAGIETNPNLFPAEKEWLKAHPDAVTDTKRNNELGVGYERAIAKGLVRGTPAYFGFLEEFMGYKTPDTNTDEGSRDVSAPVSRAERGGDGKPSIPNRITLSPEQREIAKSMGVTDIEYARQVQAFDAAKKADPDKYSARG